MKINDVIHMELNFGIHVITQKIHSSSRLNSVSCEVVDLIYKVVKYNLSLDLAEIQEEYGDYKNFKEKSL